MGPVWGTLRIRTEDLVILALEGWLGQSHDSCIGRLGMEH